MQWCACHGGGGGKGHKQNEFLVSSRRVDTQFPYKFNKERCPSTPHHRFYDQIVFFSFSLLYLTSFFRPVLYLCIVIYIWTKSRVAFNKLFKSVFDNNIMHFMRAIAIHAWWTFLRVINIVINNMYVYKFTAYTNIYIIYINIEVLFLLILCFKSSLEVEFE